MAQLTTAAVKTEDVRDLVDRLPKPEQLKIAYLTPVIYTGNGGGGQGEYAASPNAHKPNVYEIQVHQIGSGRIFAAFWEPLDNIPALPTFTYVEVVPSPEDHQDHLRLSVAGIAKDNSRLKMMIKVLYWAN